MRVNLYTYERRLLQAGLDPVAGADEAGRGACAGPLVVGAAILPPGRRGEIAELADSKLLTPAARERVYARVIETAVAWSAVVIPARDVDRIGLHRANIEGMRRAVAALATKPAYVLTDGFPVAGIGAPGLAVWKGDRVAACIAAASVIAKVTRDRLMVAMHDEFPGYGFAEHKGYVTREHQEALERHGPCAQHRRSFVNVRACDAEPMVDDDAVVALSPIDDAVVALPPIDDAVVALLPIDDAVVDLPRARDNDSVAALVRDCATTAGFDPTLVEVP